MFVSTANVSTRHITLNDIDCIVFAAQTFVGDRCGAVPGIRQGGQGRLLAEAKLNALALCLQGFA